MKMYELKMYIKRLSVFKRILKNRNRKEERVKMEELKKEGLELIDGIEETLKEYGIVYFADFGTLLGIIRDHNFISWDNDIDYGILISDNFDWNLFEKHMNKSEFYKIRQFSLHEKIREQTYRKGDLTVDFFGHKNDEVNGVVYGFYRKNGYIYHSKHDFHVREAKFIKIEKTKREAFLGIEVNVPENAEEYLASVYSENWRIPDPNWTDDAKDRKNIEVLQDLGRGVFFK